MPLLVTFSFAFLTFASCNKVMAPLTELFSLIHVTHFQESWAGGEGAADPFQGALVVIP